jgi:hypothetical protein
MGHSFDLTKIFGARGPKCLIICLMCAFTTMCCYLLASKLSLARTTCGVHRFRDSVLWPYQGQDADGLRKEMKRNVGVTTNSSLYDLITLIHDTMHRSKISLDRGKVREVTICVVNPQILLWELCISVNGTWSIDGNTSTTTRISAALRDFIAGISAQKRAYTRDSRLLLRSIWEPHSSGLLRSK